MIGAAVLGAARLQAAYQAALRPAVRAGLSIETHGGVELRSRRGPLLFYVAEDEPLDRAVVVGGLPRSLRRRTVPAQDEGQATALLENGWNVVVSGADAVRLVAVAVRLRIAVVPVGVRGTVAAVEPGRLLPRRGRPRVAVRYGLPLRPGVGETAVALAGRADQSVRALIAEDAATWWQIQRSAEPAAGEHTGPPPARHGWRRTWAQTERPLIGGRLPQRKIWQR